MFFILLCLLIAVYVDILLFKRRDREAFGDVFAISPVKAAVAIALIGAALFFSQDPQVDLSALILLLIFPMYLLRRSRLVKCMAEEEECGGASVAQLSGALGVIILWAYGVITFDILTDGLARLTADKAPDLEMLIVSAAFSSVLVMALVIQASGRFSQGGFLTNVGLRLGGRSRVKAILLPALAGCIFAFVSAYLTATRGIQPQTPLTDVLETGQSLGWIAAFLVLAVCIAPLVEEIVFRGYFFYVIQCWAGTQRAVWAVAITFAFLHVGQYWGDWLAILMVAMLGLMLTFLRAWTGTTTASVAAHYFYNAGVTVMTAVLLAVSNPAYFRYKTHYAEHDAGTKERLLQESIAKQPNLADAYNELAWLYVQEDVNLQQALGLAEKALSYAPRHQAYLDTKAEILQRLGHREESDSVRRQPEP